MTAENFPACLKLILREEGGNDDDPRDPGGRTSRGIIQREWDIYRRGHPDRPKDVWQAPQADVEAIYKTQYWNPYCDDLPSGVDLVFFNASVNSGRQQAVKELQRALGSVAVDGMMGMETLSETQAPQDYQALIHRICEQRRAFYKRLRTFKTFGRGWMARTDRMEAAARDMAPVFDPSAIPVAESGTTTTLSAKKASPDDAAKSTIDVGPAAGGSAGSTFLGGLIDQVQGLMDKLSPYQTTMQSIKILCLVLGFTLALVGVYAWYKRYKAEQVT